MTEERRPDEDWRPRPDPTQLTSKAVADALERMHEYVDGQLEVRDERIKTVATQQDAWHVATKAMIDANKAVAIEQHAALAADLRAAREQATVVEQSNQKAIDKAERSTAETIKNNQDLASSRLDGLAEQLNGVRDIVNRMDAERRGGREDRTSLYAGLAAVFIVISIIVSVAAVIAAVISASNGTPVPVPVPM